MEKKMVFINHIGIMGNYGKKYIILMEMKNGIQKSQIIFDPGIGFSKTASQSLLIIKNIQKYRVLQLPIMVGHSKKSCLDLLDIVSEGNIGLIKAAERFDPSSGLKFISYAVWWVRQSIIAFLTDNSRTIRIPSNLVQESQKQRKEQINPEDNFLIEEDAEELI